MIENAFEEINISDCEMQKTKVHMHPTLKQVQKQMKGFDESLVMYVYHLLNGRYEEARTYLQEWEEEQEELEHSFRLKNEWKNGVMEKLNSQLITDKDDDTHQ